MYTESDPLENMTCSCHEAYFRRGLDNGGGLWLNYCGLRLLPDEKWLCNLHSSLVTRIFAKSNRIESLTDEDVARFGSLRELYMPINW